MKAPPGHFDLKLTDSKNLIGEFTNSNCDGKYTEGADLDRPGPANEKFSGEYYSTWHDDCNGRHTAVITKLKIEKETGCENIFSLTWSEVKANGQIVQERFRGKGELRDGRLVGDYHSI